MASSTVSTTVLSVGALIAEVKLKKATTPSGVALKLATPEGESVKQIYRAEESGQIFDKAELERGVFTPDGFRRVDDEQMAEIDAESKLEGLDVEGFLPRASVPWDRVEGSYFLAPGGAAGPVTARALVLLRDAMAQAKLVGYGRLTLRTKQYAFVVYPENGGLLLSTMVFASQSHAHEVGEALDGVQAPAKKALDLAKALIQSMETDVSGLNALRTTGRRSARSWLRRCWPGRRSSAPRSRRSRRRRPTTWRLCWWSRSRR